MLNEFVKFLFGHNRRLNHVIRFSTRLKNYNENVASHSFYVSLYSIILADIAKELGYKINLEKLIKGSLFHDIEECASGDVITLFKKQMRKAYTKLSEMSILTVLKDLPEKQKKEYSEIWKNHSNGIEGWIIRIADDLEGLIYCQEQLDLGNSYFIDIRNDYFKRINKSVTNTKLKNLVKYLKIITEANTPTKLKSTVLLHSDKH